MNRPFSDALCQDRPRSRCRSVSAVTHNVTHTRPRHCTTPTTNPLYNDASPKIGARRKPADCHNCVTHHINPPSNDTFRHFLHPLPPKTAHKPHQAVTINVVAHQPTPAPTTFCAPAPSPSSDSCSHCRAQQGLQNTWAQSPSPLGERSDNKAHDTAPR